MTGLLRRGCGGLLEHMDDQNESRSSCVFLCALYWIFLSMQGEMSERWDYSQGGVLLWVFVCPSSVACMVLYKKYGRSFGGKVCCKGVK